MSRLAGRLRAIGAAEPRVLVLLALAAAGLWLFLAVADEVREGETHRVDEALLLLFRSTGDPSDPLGPAWVEELVRDITALGGLGVIGLITVAAVAWLVMTRAHGMALLLVLAVVGGVLLSTLLKTGFDRPRPDLVPHATRVATASFPSGHAMVATVAYLTLGAMLARAQRRRRDKLFFILLAVLLALLVGLSRIYLGVHWPSDVVAGWAAGAAWALLVWLAARPLRGPAEPAPAS
jgi:undecaprenyl-diphosphatase